MVPAAPRKIVWSVDIFERDDEIQTRVGNTLREFCRKTGAVILPVHVLSPGQLNLAVEFGTTVISEYVPAAEAAIDELIERLRLPEAGGAKVIMENFTSVAHAAQALSKYAVEEGADWIVVGTHSRTGLRHLVLGSFTEALLNCSALPVLTVGGTGGQRGSFDNILFTTELTSRSKWAFKHAVALASGLGARLTLFHAVPHPIEPIFQSGTFLLGGSWVPVQGYFSKDVDRQQKHAEYWGEWARAQGVDTEVLIQAESASIVESIEAIVRDRQIGLVIMETHSKILRAAVLGSLTREVLHHAGCPVLVYGPVAEERIRAVRLPRRPAAA